MQRLHEIDGEVGHSVKEVASLRRTQIFQMMKDGLLTHLPFDDLDMLQVEVYELSGLSPSAWICAESLEEVHESGKVDLAHGSDIIFIGDGDEFEIVKSILPAIAICSIAEGEHSCNATSGVAFVR